MMKANFMVKKIGFVCFKALDLWMEQRKSIDNERTLKGKYYVTIPTINFTIL